MADLITLTAGGGRAVIAPDVGGALVGWWRDGVALLRPTPDDVVAAKQVRSFAAYPLVPYSNRIANAHFSFADIDYELAPNFAGERHAVHGNGWQNPWHVEDASATSVGLIFVHEPDGERALQWPFAFTARQRIDLTPDALSIALSIQNTDSRAFPAGLGHHPFFPRSAGARLTFEADGMWSKEADGLPGTLLPFAGDFDHSAGRAVGPVALDNCFSGWTHRMRADFPASNLSIAMQADLVFRDCIVYVPPGRDFFAFEPVSHMPDAIHRMESVPDNGLKVLQPRQGMSGRYTMRIQSLARGQA